MKFATYLRKGQPRVAVVDGEAAIDLNDVQPQVHADLRTALRVGADLPLAARVAIGSTAQRHPLADLTYAPLLPEPGKTICLGLNYFDHAKEAGRDKPEYPWFFYRGASSLLAHGEPGRVPRVSSKFDYEGELAVVIGTRVPRHVSQADALKHVFGYSCFNDMSVRDFQKRTPQWTIGKNFDRTGGFGPVLVTADEVPPGAIGLRIQSRLNGQVSTSCVNRVLDGGRRVAQTRARECERSISSECAAVPQARAAARSAGRARGRARRGRGEHG